MEQNKEQSRFHSKVVKVFDLVQRENSFNLPIQREREREKRTKVAALFTLLLHFWFVRQLQWMTKTSQSVLIRVTPDCLYTPPWVSWENSVEHWMIYPGLIRKTKQKQKYNKTRKQTLSFKASESDCLHMLALTLFGLSDLPLTLYTPAVSYPALSISNHSHSSL